MGFINRPLKSVQIVVYLYHINKPNQLKLYIAHLIY